MWEPSKLAEHGMSGIDGQLQALLELSDTLIALVDRHYNFLFANQSFLDFYQLNRIDVEGHHISDVIGRDLFNNVVRETLEQASRGDTTTYTSWFQFPRAGYRFCEFTFKPLEFPDGEFSNIAIYVRDETANQEQTNRLEEMANTDPLTGTFNRRYFIDFGDREMDRARRYKRPLSLLLIDLNDFKAVNDTHGHDAGDKLLIAVCKAVESAIRSSDCFARIGGDEFAVILPEQDQHQAMEVSLKIRAAIEKSMIQVGREKIYGSASTGIATLHRQMTNFNQLWKTADHDLYSHKPSARQNKVKNLQQDKEPSQLKH